MYIVAAFSETYSFFDTLRIIFCLVLVISLLIATLYFMKWTGNIYRSQQKIKVLERCALSVDKSIYAIKIDAEVYYLYTDKQVAKILTIHDAEQDLELEPGQKHEQEQKQEVLEHSDQDEEQAK